jgi:hypothetical protein
LAALPNNPVSSTAPVSYATCPADPQVSPRRSYKISAVTAQKALSGITPVPGNPSQGELIFNDRGPRDQWIGSLMGIMFVRDDDLQNGVLKTGTPVEPLILRANAGDCIEVTLTNRIDPSSLVMGHNFNWPPPFKPPIPQKMSKFVGLHPQLLSYDAATSFGMNVGWNSQGRPDQFAGFNQSVKYTWYAGKIDRDTTGKQTYTPVEFGALNLFSSDPLFQHPNGLIGQMIVEPKGTTWDCGDPGTNTPCDAQPTTRAAATIKLNGNQLFREFSVMISDALQTSSTTAAVNYRSEPKTQRYLPNVANSINTDFSCMTSNRLEQAGSSPAGDPKTPIFKANPGDQVRFRMTHPLGTGDSLVFTVHGHSWQRNPYQNNSLIIGNNNLSQWLGSRDNHGSSDHFELLIPKAGGEFGKQGDYLYTAYLADQASLGVWGLFRVGNPSQSGQANAVCKNLQGPTASPQPKPPEAQDLHNRFHRQPQNPGGSRP